MDLISVALTLHFTVPHLKRAGKGSIVIISSINGTRVFSHGGASAYSTTKGGLVSLTQMVALELAKHKIRVNVVCPGKVESEIAENTSARSTNEASEPAIYPAGRIPLTDGTAGSSDDIAEMVAFLASERAKFITGTRVWTDGGSRYWLVEHKISTTRKDGTATAETPRVMRKVAKRGLNQSFSGEAKNTSIARVRYADACGVDGEFSTRQICLSSAC